MLNTKVLLLLLLLITPSICVLFCLKFICLPHRFSVIKINQVSHLSCLVNCTLRCICTEAVRSTGIRIVQSRGIIIRLAVEVASDAV